MLNKMLLPESWLVQPDVIPIHVLRDPERRRMPSVVGEREGKRVSTYVASVNCSRRRMLAVSMNPPDDGGMHILRHILTAGDRRYWSWAATKPHARGSVRRSLAWELDMDKSNLKKSLNKLIDDEVLMLLHNQAGREVVAFTDVGRMIFAEMKWRWYLREAAPEFLQPMADNYGWQEIAIQVDRYIAVEELDASRKADVVLAAKNQLKDGVENGGTVQFPERWAGV